MPSYFYHLKFELYPYPFDDSEASDQQGGKEDGGKRGVWGKVGEKKDKRTKEEEEERRRVVWVPGERSDIFETGDWPAHAPVISSVPAVQGENEPDYTGTESRRERKSLGSATKKEPGAAVIDCGPHRARISEEGEEAGLVGGKAAEFPTPRPGNIQRDLKIAKQDWRFGRVRIEGLNLDPFNKDAGGNMDSANVQVMRTRGESSSAGAGVGVGTNGLRSSLSAATSGVGVGGGRVTKARFDVAESKNTEVGWGIVHLYRDG